MPLSMPASSADDMVLSKTIRINEIFLSIQGESSRTGLPTSFIRFTGCPLRCHYCDTAYAFHQGSNMTIKEIEDKISSNKTPFVTVTGGEPLAQKSCLSLLEFLCNQKYKVSLETSGAIDISQVDRRVMKVMDLKTPGSGEVERNLYENLNFINEHDEIKFVICDRNDYEWSKNIIEKKGLINRCRILFSPEHESLEAHQLAKWILDDRINVKLQIQLHKYLWGNVPGK